MAEIMISKFKYKPPEKELTQEMVFKAVAEMKYRSPVEIVSQNIHENFENGVMEVIHSYDVKVDKDELIKALSYDREQYKQGYADGCKLDTNAIKSKFAEDLLSEIKKEAHNKAVHPCGCKIDPYISLKVLDGIIQKYINEYYGK